MIGYATTESEELLPLTMVYATRLAMELEKNRKSKTIPWLRPDAKTQVTIKYNKYSDGTLEPITVETVLISAQHAKDI